MNQRERNILVYADWQELENPVLMGILSATLLRGETDLAKQEQYFFFHV